VFKVFGLQSQLFKTTAFRLTAAFVVVFSVLIVHAMSLTHRALNERIGELVDERLQVESDLMARHYNSGVLPSLLSAIEQQGERFEGGRFYYLADESDGDVQEPFQALPLTDQHARTGSAFYSLQLSDFLNPLPVGAESNTPIRVISTPLGADLRLFIAHDISSERSLSTFLRKIMFGLIFLTIFLALAGGLWVSLLSIRRVDAITKATSDIISGDLSRRLRVEDSGNEFDLLSSSINLMLNRIEELMESMREVTNNIAHDLRSPLTRLRARLDFAQRNEQSAEQYKDVLNAGIGEADNLIGTFNALMSIARMEAGVQQERMADVHLAELIEELFELYEPLAEELNLTLELDIDCSPLLRGDRQLLAQALTNLLDNAFNYAACGGYVVVRLRTTEDGKVVLEVEDRGAGIPEHERERVFQRFVRLETERNSPGNGLGLSLVKAIVDMHHGSVHMEGTEPGLRVVTQLPLPGTQKLANG